MERRKGMLERLAMGMDLPGEAMPGQPIVELADYRRVLIENHNGVTEYGRERISVRVRYGTIEVCGSGLELARMTKEQLIITGSIHGVSLHRREK